ncbi:MAG: Crp/Fnr family transcriptional regulator [Acidobacteria bacterium]|nr:Crp/Fnr family transcriptional regulator [Acidobacteriota bacterium]
MPEARLDRAAALRKTPLFADLSDKELQFLAERALVRRYAANEVIFSAGDPCEGLYVIESGTVRIFKTSAGGREQVLGFENAGNSVAELPVFDGGDYPASTSAVGEATLLLIRRQDFHTLCRQHPEVALKVLRVVGGRLRRLVGIIEELSFTTVRHRLAALLLRLARRKGQRGPRGVEFTLTASNQELAAHTGTVRELVSRNLGRLQAEGIIQLQGKNIIIPDLKALEAEVESGE